MTATGYATLPVRLGGTGEFATASLLVTDYEGAGPAPTASWSSTVSLFVIECL